MKINSIRAIKLQRGASLLEAVAFLGIAAIVILGAIALLRGAFTGANTNKASQEIASLRTSVTKLFSAQGYPTGVFAATLNAAGGVPSSMKINTGTDAASTAGWINGFGGVTTVGGINAGTYYISYSWLPKEACIQLVTGEATASTIQVQTQASTPSATAPTASTAVPAAAAAAAGSGIFNVIPVSVIDATTACSPATSSNRVAVTFYQ